MLARVWCRRSMSCSCTSSLLTIVIWGAAQYQLLYGIELYFQTGVSFPYILPMSLEPNVGYVLLGRVHRGRAFHEKRWAPFLLLYLDQYSFEAYNNCLWNDTTLLLEFSTFPWLTPDLREGAVQRWTGFSLASGCSREDLNRLASRLDSAPFSLA